MVSTNTFLQDTILHVKSVLTTKVTDPIVSSRSSNSRFVMTSNARRQVQYPMITIQDSSITEGERLGQQSEKHELFITMELSIKARNVIERDDLTQDCINALRANQYPTSTSTTSTSNKLYDFKLINSFNVPRPGEANFREKIIEIQYMFILGGI